VALETQGKEVAEEQLLEGGVGRSPGGVMTTRMREIEARGVIVTGRVSSEYQKVVVMTRVKKD
jgi:uncharacterized glyoxalase superfamily metalloenzyme YdcJ